MRRERPASVWYKLTLQRGLRMPFKRVVGLIFLAALLFAATDSATHSDWPSYGGTHAAWRFSALDQINTGNVKSLAPAWVFQTGDYDNGLLSTPIALDG